LVIGVIFGENQTTTLIFVLEYVLVIRKYMMALLNR